MKKITILSFCLILFLSSYQEKRCLLLIFKNDTDEDFKQLEVYTRDGSITFYDVAKGQSTKPFPVSGSYKFTYAKAITSTDTVATPGYCRSGEKFFTDGQLTMALKIQPGGYGGKKWLSIKPFLQDVVDTPLQSNISP